MRPIMSDCKTISIRLLLEGDLAMKFCRVQEKIGLKNQSEVLRYLITKAAKEENL